MYIFQFLLTFMDVFIFQVLNAQHRFDNAYLECVSDQMNDLKPFGDEPNKLILDIKRSFVATRTFVQALSVGKDVVKNIMEVCIYIFRKYINIVKLYYFDFLVYHDFHSKNDFISQKCIYCSVYIYI